MPPSARPEHVLAAILSSTQDALAAFALDGTIQAWSKGAEHLYGYSKPEIMGQSIAKLLLPVEAMNIQAIMRRLEEPARAAITPGEFCDRLHKNGSAIRVALIRSVVQNETGEIVAIVERASRAERTPSADPPLLSLLEHMPAFLWTTDADLRITSNWGSEMHAARVKPGDLSGSGVPEFLKSMHASSLPQYAAALRGGRSRFEFKLRNRDFEIRLGPFRDPSGKIVGCIGAGIDISERKRSEEELRYQATHDALTGLANYREFLNSLEREVCRAERANHSFAVLLLDLDDLKRVNDRWGHLAGNRALRRLGDVISEHCRATDLPARYGGDEFAILLIDADPAMARHIAQRVEDALDKNQEEPNLSVSIGIGIYPDDGRTARELLESADQQLYKCKRGSHRRVVSAP
jgi:diguanylate cyclase (GGDEF)-like protein/PAS domain S-box-containing protein